eukprot:200676-Chlamydomonas_euryale.AAC.13
MPRRARTRRAASAGAGGAPVMPALNARDSLVCTCPCPQRAGAADCRRRREELRPLTAPFLPKLYVEFQSLCQVRRSSIHFAVRNSHTAQRPASPLAMSRCKRVPFEAAIGTCLHIAFVQLPSVRQARSVRFAYLAGNPCHSQPGDLPRLPVTRSLEAWPQW